jgi:hypothetical protein
MESDPASIETQSRWTERRPLDETKATTATSLEFARMSRRRVAFERGGAGPAEGIVDEGPRTVKRVGRSCA